MWRGAGEGERGCLARAPGGGTEAWNPDVVMVVVGVPEDGESLRGAGWVEAARATLGKSQGDLRDGVRRAACEQAFQRL